MAVVGYMGYRSMNQIKKSHQEYSMVHLPSVLSIGTIFESIRSITVGERGMLIPKLFIHTEKRKKQYSLSAFERIEKARQKYESLPHTEEEEKLWASYTVLWEQWMQVHNQFIGYCDEKGAHIDKGVDFESKKKASAPSYPKSK
jgi:hypothetical protein